MRAHDAQKNEIKPWLRKQWVIPPQASADFVCAMEDVLEVYTRPHDPAYPVVCLDEISKHLVAETRLPILTSVGFFMSHLRALVMIRYQGTWTGRARVPGNRGREVTADD